MPPTFGIERINGRKYYCCQKKVLIYGELVQCSYRVRSDHMTQEKFKHKCKGPTIMFFLSRIHNENNSDNVLNKIFIAVSKLDISIRSATSDIFKDLLMSIYKLGQANPKKELKSVIPLLSRKTFTKKYIENAEIIRKIQLQSFAHLPYSTLLLDAGKINGVEYLTVILANTRIKPMVYFNHRYFHGTVDNYTYIVENHILKLKDLGIKISSIVGDNLPVQKSALKETSSIGMQENTDEPDVHSVIFCSCMCHCMSLAIKDLKKINSNFSEMVDELKYVSEILKTNYAKSNLMKSCPGLCFTRWNIICDVSKWIFDNKDIINTLLRRDNKRTYPRISQEDKKIIYNVINKVSVNLVLLLTPISRLINIFESNSTKFLYSDHLVKQAAYVTCEIISISNIELLPIAFDLSRTMIARLEFGGGEFARAFYILTLQGKKEIEKYKKFQYTDVYYSYINERQKDNNDILYKKMHEIPPHLTKEVHFHLTKKDYFYVCYASELCLHGPYIRISDTSTESSEDDDINLPLLPPIQLFEEEEENNSNNNSEEPIPSNEQPLLIVDEYSCSEDDLPPKQTIQKKEKQKRGQLTLHFYEDNNNTKTNQKQNDSQHNDNDEANNLSNDYINDIDNANNENDKVHTCQKQRTLSSESWAPTEESEISSEDFEYDIEEQEDVPYSDSETSDESENEEEEKFQYNNNDGQIEENAELSEVDLCWKTLYNLAIRCNYNDINQIHEAYIVWITRSLKALNLPECKENTDDDIWSILSYRPFFKQLADLRERVSSIPSSEAECERTLSLLKRVIKSNSTRTSEELEQAKISYIKLDYEENFKK